MVLVVGATGALGSEICRKLSARGLRVRALIRSTSDEAKVEALRNLGADLHVGDLKDPASLAGAFEEVEAIISTASSTFSRQEGDSIESVDGTGQLNLVEAAKAAGVERFVLVSFRHSPAFPFPLSVAKANVEQAIAGMNFTVIQASFFMESWLSPGIGFDYVNGAVRVCGTGKSPISWVSLRDVAEVCVQAIVKPETERKTIEFGGPRALSTLDAVDVFQKVTGRQFSLEFVPEESLMQQFNEAVGPMQKTFAALMLGAAYGDAIEVDPIVSSLGLRMTTVEEYAEGVAQK